MATPIEEPQLKTKKPSNSAFKQQRLPAWQPILTAGTVLPTFFVIGLAFIPIGIGLLVSSNEVKEKQVDYTYCNSTKFPDKTCDELIRKTPNETCTCELTFTLDESFKANVYMYYGLTNYYQNHRRYVKSRSDQQLLGKQSYSVGECEPFALREIDGKVYKVAPCGAIANSLFNDSLTLRFKDETAGGEFKLVPLIKSGITWPTDSVKYHNPSSFEGTVKPPSWGESLKQNYTDEDLIVWMRTAALPTFRKLYRRINHDDDGFRNNLPKGTYKLNVLYQYPVTSFQGTKRMILSNTSWLGGRNPFLGIAYIVVGTICLLLAFVFLVIHNKFGRRRYGWQSTPSCAGDTESTRLRTTANLD